MQFPKIGRIFNMTNSTYFRIPLRLNAVLYFLYQFPNIDDEEHYSQLIKYLQNTHTSEEIAGIKEAIEWALKTKDFAFSEQLPNLRKTNHEILEFFDRLNQKLVASSEIMEQIESGQKLK